MDHSHTRVLAQLAVATIVLGSVVGRAAEMGHEAGRAPFKVLFGNDSTNISSCNSPYHRRGRAVTDDMIRASIDEAAAADCHLLQPGLGWIPFWQSKVYPPAEHFRFYQEKFGYRPSSFANYLLAGGDVVKTFVEHCRSRKIAPFVSMRLNDGHGLETAGTDDRYAGDTVSRFYLDHYQQYRLGPDRKDWSQRVLNWAVPEVRQHKFAFIRELCEDYDIDGLELDFLRHFSYFWPGETTSQQRRQIMTGFVQDVRQVLDRTSRGGRHRWLCVRVPAMTTAHDALGIDLPAMTAAGVEMVNLSCSYFTVQQLDLQAVRKLVPKASLYLEMAHTTLTGPGQGKYDSSRFERTVPQQFYTTAHLAYGQGVDGMSLFNFVYYRDHGTEGRGPFCEPPFEVLGKLGDRAWLARQPRWYFIAAAVKKPIIEPWPLPRIMKRGESAEFRFQMQPREESLADGLVRVLADRPVPGNRWRASLNAAELPPAPFVRKPLETPIEAFLGQPDQYACFRCPRSAVRAGLNELRLTHESGIAAKVMAIDVILP